MQHVVQLGINIDDDAIRRGVEKDATKKIVAEVTSDMENILFKSTPYGGKPYEVSYVGEEIIKDWLNDNKDEIIKATIKCLADRLMRTKTVKDYITSTVLEDMGKESKNEEIHEN